MVDVQRNLAVDDDEGYARFDSLRAALPHVLGAKLSVREFVLGFTELTTQERLDFTQELTEAGRLIRRCLKLID